MNDPSTVDELREALAYYPGDMPVMLMVVVDGDPEAQVPLSSTARWENHDGVWCALVGPAWDEDGSSGVPLPPSSDEDFAALPVFDPAILGDV